MGLFDKYNEYKENKKQKRIEKATRLVKNAKAIREDRWAAIQYLAGLSDDPEAAVPSLLQRFEYSLEHGINDTREKELAMEGIIQCGARAVPLIQAHMKTTTRIAWPIKALKELSSEEQLADVLIDALDFRDVSFDQAAVDKNYDILCYLRDIRLPQHAAKLAHFLKDPDERVRFACSEFLIEQESAELAPALEPFLLDESAENRRIRQTVLKAFLKHGWKITKPEAFPDGRVEPGIVINQKGTLEALRH